MTGYYRRFVEGFAMMARSFKALTKKGNSISMVRFMLKEFPRVKKEIDFCSSVSSNRGRDWVWFIYKFIS